MPRRKFNKKDAQTFSLVHRSVEDPLYHDADAPARVLVPVTTQKDIRNKKKVKTAEDLEKELQDEITSGKIRQNEGEAALYGITFDDSKYDYMKHLKPIGEGEGVFIARSNADDAKPKKAGVLFKDEIADVLPSKEKVASTYQNFQNVPDDIAGFKPDMDPRIREALEALEDEAYVDEDDGIFGELIGSGKAGENEEEFDEWDMDNYEDEFDSDKYQSGNDQDFEGSADNAGYNENWINDFKKFEISNKSKKNEWDSDDEFEDEEDDEVLDLPSLDKDSNSKKIKKGRLRKKKGAMTDVSSFSMSSSALFRTEGQRLMDDKHDIMVKKYQEPAQEEDYKPFDMKTERADLENLLDDFLDNYELQNGGRKLAKKDKEIQRLKDASDSVSKGKLATRRNTQKQKESH